VTLSDQAPRGSAPAADDGSIPLDLRIAVTGHRRLACTPALSAAIDRALDLITDQLRPSIRDRCRLVVVSALADGADRVVAERALARPGARLEVILPMPEADYVTDFEPAHSLPEFEHLLGAASWVATIPSSRTRQDAYLAAGRAVIDRADVTIAIWDGLPAAGKGGTGDIVRCLREQGRPWIWIPGDGGQLAAENLGKLADIGWLAMKDPDLARFCEFNEARLAARRLAASIDDFRRSILSAGGADLTADLGVLLSWLQGPLARADLLSSRFQSLYLRLSAMLFTLAAAAVWIVGAQLVFFPQVRFVVAGEVACLVGILAGLEWGRRARLQQRWISARYLAERLRSAFFLALIGADEESSAAAFVSGDIPVAPWVGIAFDMTWTRRPQVDTGRTSVVSLRDLLSRAWVDDQRSYFKDASARAQRKYQLSRRAVEALFAVSLVIAAVHVSLGGPEDWVHHVVSWLAISIPAGAAALAGYSSQREYHRHSLRYCRVADSLADANDLMLAAADHAKVRQIAASVDRLLRQERGEWFGTAALHDLELPA
jgi:hypothetical protein